MKVVLVKYTIIEFCVVFLQGYTMKFRGSELLLENKKGKCDNLGWVMGARVLNKQNVRL